MIEPGSAPALIGALGLTTAGSTLLAKVFGPSADDAGLWLREKFNGRRKRVVDKAAADLETAHIEPREVPLRLLAPILENAALEDDATLSDKWAALLANAAAGEKGAEVSPRFAHILSLLTPEEARLFDIVADDKKVEAIGQSEAKGEASNSGVNFQRMALLLSSLASHGLLEEVTVIRGPGGSSTMKLDGKKRFQLSPLGFEFFKACQPPGHGAKPVKGSYVFELGDRA
jgi:hypothetical protein